MSFLVTLNKIWPVAVLSCREDSDFSVEGKDACICPEGQSSLEHRDHNEKSRRRKPIPDNCSGRIQN